MNIPKPTLTRIEADAKSYSDQRDTDLQDKKYIHRKTTMFYAYQAGAKKEVERAEGLVEALKQIEQMSDPGDNWKAICQMKSIASDALAKYKEVGNG